MQDELQKAINLLTVQDLLRYPSVEWAGKRPSSIRVTRHSDCVSKNGLWYPNLPTESGVYFVLVFDSTTPSVIYIGQGKNLKKRWRGHDLADELDEVVLEQQKRVVLSWFLTPDYLYAEELFIRHFKPSKNTVGIKETHYKPVPK